MSRWLPRSSLLGYSALVLALLVLDQGTKWLALESLTPGRPVPLTPFLNLTLAFNPGAAFSLLSTAGGWQRWFFIAVGLGAIVLIGAWLARSTAAPRGERLGLALILAGAAGNVIDRIVHGVVVDFVDVHAGGWHWPVFNVADSAICIGIALLLWATLRPRAKPDEAPGQG